MHICTTLPLSGSKEGQGRKGKEECHYTVNSCSGMLNPSSESEKLYPYIGSSEKICNRAEKDKILEKYSIGYSNVSLELYFYCQISDSWGFALDCWHHVFRNYDTWESEITLSAMNCLAFCFYSASGCFWTYAIIPCSKLSHKCRYKVQPDWSLNAGGLWLFSFVPAVRETVRYLHRK